MRFNFNNLNFKPGSGMQRNVMAAVRGNQMLMALFIALLLFVIGGFVSTNFLSLTNIGSILSMAVLLGFVAAGQTLVVISGGEGVDLSVGAATSLGAVLAVEIMHGQNNAIIPALILIIAAGALIGILNAIGIIVARVPPLVMTMAMANVVTTVQLIYTNGTPTGHPAGLVALIGSGRLLPVLPWLVVIGILAMVLMQALLRHTTYGYQLYAVGSNSNASYLAGVRVSLIRGGAYVLSGMLSAMAGFWLIAYNNFAFVNMGVAYTLPSVAAVVIGGTSLAGGGGSYSGTMIGAIVLTVLGSLLVVLHTDEAGRQIINGVVLIALLAAYTRRPPIRQ
ncbi:MAG: ABC transporter permease [Firmicutes bacterium]|nr:ABC transporter permease [Bacillota bacterium]